MLKIYKRGVLALALYAAVALSGAFYFENTIPDTYRFEAGQQYTLKGSSLLNITRPTSADSQAAALGDDFFADITFLGAHIKSVHITAAENKKVLVSGKPFGVKMTTKGVVVISYSAVDGPQNVSPGKKAGLQPGDILLYADGQSIGGNDDLKTIAARGKSVDLIFLRDDKQYTASLAPVKDYAGNYKFGIWVRDSSAGIGTMTFVDPVSAVFAGLGHGIADTDTKQMLPLSGGYIVAASIIGVQKGTKGTPGQLKGSFDNSTVLGSLQQNAASGLYGRYTGSSEGLVLYAAAPLTSVKKGKAQILSTIDGSTPRFYDIQITSVNYNKKKVGKNMVISITDPDLLSVTGGIVQGMSGSPIIQNGKLIGAVTHVLVNDPTKGYGIFIENMLDAAG